METQTPDAGGAHEPPASHPGGPRPDRIGRFQIVSELGRGGMGVVYAARMHGAHGVSRLVALKTLTTLTSPSARAALLSEATLTAKLHHRNVVSTLELGEVERQPYVVMELVDGVSLARLLARLASTGETLAPDLAAWVVMQVALGLHAAHELAADDGAPLGLVHRDVTPQNVLVSTSGEVKLADFGIAKYAGGGEPTAKGLIKGKFAYMSPEQCQGLALDRRSDVFALGVVLWEALTGARLFAAETPAQTLLRIRTLQPTPPHVRRPDVARSLSMISLRCLAREAAERFASAAEVAEAIRTSLRERSAHVDESDLAVLVARHFGAERQDETSALAGTGNATGGLDGTTIVDAPPRRRGPRILVLAMICLAAVLAAAVATSARRSARQPSSPAPSSSWITR